MVSLESAATKTGIHLFYEEKRSQLFEKYSNDIA
jgi:hypothetical protein